jgi:hypothetical protein
VITLVVFVVLTPKLRFLLDDSATKDPDRPAVIVIESACDVLQGSCLVTLDMTRSLSFSYLAGVGNASRGSAGTFSFLSTVVSGDTPQNMQLRIEGRDMFMGIVERSFSQQPEASFVVDEVILPACSIDSDMVWLLITSAEYANQTYQVIFSIRNSFH